MNNALLSNIIISINQTGSIERAFSTKFTYGQIGRALVYLMKEEYVAYNNGIYNITSKGNEYIKEHGVYEEKQVNKKYLRTDKLMVDDLYVPKYDGGSTEEK